MRVCAVWIVVVWALVLPAAEPAAPALHERLAPAVVGITCRAPYPGSSRIGGYYGTGVVVRADGYILSNITVVPDKASDIAIYLTDGRVLPAKQLAVDRASEGSLLKVDAEGLVYMPLRRSRGLAVGDAVFTWGNPFWTIQRDGMVSLSHGIISGLHTVASVDDQSRYRGAVIETDAALNPGSDGGPLTDAEGNCIGIMSLALSQTRWLGLAIPSDVLIDQFPVLRSQTAVQAAQPSASPREQLFQQHLQGVQPALLSIAYPGQQLPLRLKDYELAELAAIPGARHATAQEQIPQRGFFTGTCINAEKGLVVTSARLIAAVAADAQVLCYDHTGWRHELELVGQSAVDDLALLRFVDGPPSGLGEITVPAAVEFTVGQSVALLGRSELPEAGHMTLGRISAVRRGGTNLIQHSALCNVGNLGGPLIDVSGQLVGIAVCSDSTTPLRQNSGVAFALLGKRVNAVLRSLERGRTPRPSAEAWLGVEISMKHLNDPGVRLGEIAADGPAQRAGLRYGDVVLGADGEDFAGVFDFFRWIEQAREDDLVRIKVERDGEIFHETLRLGAKR